jgi:hypothetical protein
LMPRRLDVQRAAPSIHWLISSQRRPVAYLDTNVVSNLSRWQERAPHIEGLGQVRRSLCSYGSKRTIAVGQWLFSELAFLEDHQRRRHHFIADMSFVNEIQFLHLVRSSGEMIELEKTGFEKGLRPNPFMSIERPIDFDNPKWREVWAEERRLMQRDKQVFLVEDAAGSKRAHDAHPDKEERVQKLGANWAEDREGTVRRWVRKQLKHRRHRHGHGAVPPPELIRTLWCHWAYLITRTMLIELREDRADDDGDLADLCHYQTGAYADELVTSDKRFRQIAKEAPGPKPEILSLEEWVARLR